VRASVLSILAIVTASECWGVGAQPRSGWGAGRDPGDPHHRVAGAVRVRTVPRALVAGQPGRGHRGT
jgi:hypothetical protein